MHNLERLMAIAARLPSSDLEELVEHAEQLGAEQAYFLSKANNNNKSRPAMTWVELLQPPMVDHRGLHGIDKSLLTRQARGEAESLARSYELHDAACRATVEILESWGDVMAGKSVAVNVGKDFDAGPLGWAADLRADLGGALGEAQLEEAEASARFSEEQAAPLRGALIEAVMGVFARRGLIKGPCLECARPHWVPPYAKGRHGGHNRLSAKLCPSCEARHIAKREAAKKRSQRKKPKQAP